MQQVLKCVRCEKDHEWSLHFPESSPSILERVLQALCEACRTDVEDLSDYKEVYTLYVKMFSVND